MEQFRWFDNGHNTSRLESNIPADRGEHMHTSDVAGARAALETLRKFAGVGAVLGLLALVAGIMTLVWASENIGFPVFNFGPLLVGLVYTTCMSLGYFNTQFILKREINQQSIGRAKWSAIVVFIACVLCVTLSTLSAAFAFLSGAVCAGADITFHSRKGNVRTKLDVEQYCLPRETENKVMGFVDGVICVLLAVWCIFGCIFFCCDGRYLGIKSRRRV